METKVLHLAVNEDKKEKLLQQELMLDHAVLLPSYHYHDNIEQYDKQEVLTAMKKGARQTTTEGHVRGVRQVYAHSRTTTKSCQDSLGSWRPTRSYYNWNYWRSSCK